MESINKRQDEATSKETLEDLEDTESSVETDDTDAPSPDGAFDEVEDELNNADPI
jgi:hypothetical protein